MDGMKIEGQHVGCYDLGLAIKKIKPKYHIFGHIHCQYGIFKKKDTSFINCSVSDEEYYLVNKPIIFDYEK
jgi:Icc-related predicted phosphoesterase